MKLILPIALLVAVASLTAKEPLKMNPVPAETLQYAESGGNVYQMRFRYDLRGGAHTNAGDTLGRLLAKSLASYLGDHSTDDSFVKQIQFLLEGPNTISAVGSYPSQHEHIFLSSLIVARETPKLWERFSDEEKKKIDLLMKAHLVGNAFTTSDQTNPGRTAPPAMDGSKNHNRAWNPNYQEGMIGGLILGAVWLGPKEAQAFLDSYDHVKFTEQLKEAGLTNTYEIFTWKANNPDSEAPTPEEINEALHGFRYFDMDLTNPMEIFLKLSANTYGAIVAAGLNNGEGKEDPSGNIGGKIAQNADKVPNIGKKGMLLEFASIDGGGPRSCAGYSYGGIRTNLAKQIAMMVTGHLDYKHPQWKEIFEQIRVGNEDIIFKLEEGYISFSHGKSATQPTAFDGRDDKTITRDLWQKVVLPYHESQTK